MGVGLFVGIWLARYLGPEQYGILSYAVAFVSLFGVLATLGMDQIVVRDIVRSADEADEILGTAFALKFCGAIMAIGAIIAVISVMRPREYLTLSLVGIIAAGTIFQSFDIIDFWFQAHVQSKYVVYARNSAFLIVAFLRVCLIMTQAPLIAFAFAALAEIVLGAVGLVIFYQRRAMRLYNWRFSFQRARALLNQTWPLLISGFAIMVFTRIDQVLLGNLIGNTELGIYVVAVRLTELFNFIPAIVASSIYPSLIKAYEASAEVFYDRLKRVVGGFFWSYLLLSVVVVVVSRPLIYILYGVEFSRSADVLSILMYSSIFVSMGTIFFLKFVIEGTIQIGMYGTLMSAVLNIILNLWLIPIYGASGAAIATLLSYSLSIIPQSLLFDRQIGVIYFSSIFYVFKRKVKY